MGVLELAALGADEWLGAGAWGTWSWAKVLDGLTLTAWSLEKDSVLTLWCLEGELIESDDLTTGGQEADVIGDGTDDNSGLVGTGVSLHLADQTGQRHWWAVDVRHEETLQDDLVEVGAGAAGQEAVGLDEETEVDI